MTVYIDEPMGNSAFGHTAWAHLAVGSDDDPKELHAFAKRLGLQRRYFQDHNPMYLHYDVTADQRNPTTPSRWQLAIDLGAVLLRRADRVTIAQVSQRLIPCTAGCGRMSGAKCAECGSPFCGTCARPIPGNRKRAYCPQHRERE